MLLREPGVPDEGLRARAKLLNGILAISPPFTEANINGAETRKVYTEKIMRTWILLAMRSLYFVWYYPLLFKDLGVAEGLMGLN